MVYLPYTLVMTHKTSAFGVHEGGMLMVTACFDKREHLGGKRLHQKMSVGDEKRNATKIEVKIASSQF